MATNPVLGFLTFMLGLTPLYIGQQDQRGHVPLVEVDTVSFDRLARMACHNCYEPQYSPTLANALDRTDAIEIDVYDAPSLFTKKGARPGYWYVRHRASAKPSGNNSCCSGTNGSSGLDSCLQDVARWSRHHPGHLPITVFVDKKQGWSAQHGPQALDQLIRRYFPSEALFCPSALRQGMLSPRQAALAGQWPVVKMLRGKVLFVLTGGYLLAPNRTLASYVQARGDSAVLFVAPQVSTLSELVTHPHGFAARDTGFVAIYNFDAAHVALGRWLYTRHLLSRTFNVPEDSISQHSLLQYINYVAAFKLGRPVYHVFSSVPHH